MITWIADLTPAGLSHWSAQHSVGRLDVVERWGGTYSWELHRDAPHDHWHPLLACMDGFGSDASARQAAERYVHLWSAA